MPRFVYGPNVQAPARVVPAKGDPAVTAEFVMEPYSVAVALPAFDPAAFSRILAVHVAFVAPGVAVPDDPRALIDDAATPRVTLPPGEPGVAAVLSFPIPAQFEPTGCGQQVILELAD
jgi:hypothetical protein